MRKWLGLKKDNFKKSMHLKVSVKTEKVCFFCTTNLADQVNLPEPNEN